MSRKLHKFQTVAEYQSLVSDGGDTYGLNETLCLNYIPSGVTSMSSTFGGCTSLNEVTFLHTTPPSYNNTLYGCSKLESIYVPYEAVDAFKTATGWSQFASKIKPLSKKPSEYYIIKTTIYIYVKIFKRFQYPCRIPSIFCIH